MASPAIPATAAPTAMPALASLSALIALAAMVALPALTAPAVILAVATALRLLLEIVGSVGTKVRYAHRVLAVRARWRRRIVGGGFLSPDRHGSGRRHGRRVGHSIGLAIWVRLGIRRSIGIGIGARTAAAAGRTTFVHVYWQGGNDGAVRNRRSVGCSWRCHAVARYGLSGRLATASKREVGSTGGRYMEVARSSRASWSAVNYTRSENHCPAPRTAGGAHYCLQYGWNRPRAQPSAGSLFASSSRCAETRHRSGRFLRRWNRLQRRTHST